MTIAATRSDDDIRAAINSEPPIAHRAIRTGWRRSYGAFVCTDYVVGQSDDIELLPPVHPMVAAGRIASEGTLKSWQKLAAIARYSTMMIVCLSAAFAAPLVSVLNRPSFALVLVGPSRCGKSTAQILAASVLGFGSEEDLPSLNATSAGLLATAITFNDLLLPINEVGTARGSKDEVYVALRDATYALMNGQDTMRHPSWTGANPGSPTTFKVLCLLSSEISPDAWAARNSQTRDEGEMARLIGVPVPLSVSKTIFDRAPEMDDSERRKWERAQFDTIRAGLPKKRGIGFKRFLEEFLNGGNDTREKAAALAQSFERRMAKHASSAVARDILAKFAIVYAGGVLASDFGIIPLKPASIFNATRKTCLLTLGELPDHDAELASDLVRLQEKLSSGGVIEKDTASQKKRRMFHSADGYSDRKAEGREYVIRATSFAATFATPLRVRRVLDWLDGEGLLTHSREPTAKRSNAWAQTQVTWPNGTRVRSIVIYIPNSISDLKP